MSSLFKFNLAVAVIGNCRAYKCGLLRIAQKEASAMLLGSCRLLFSTLSLPAAVLLVAGCSGTQATQTTSSQSAVTAPAFVVGTDAPMASVTSFSVQVNSITATDASNNSVSLLSGQPTVDFARFNGLQTLLDMNDVPVGTYTSVSLGLGPSGGLGPMATRSSGSKMTCRNDSKARSPLTQQYRSPVGAPTFSTQCASDPCMQGFNAL